MTAQDKDVDTEWHRERDAVEELWGVEDPKDYQEIAAKMSAIGNAKEFEKSGNPMAAIRSFLDAGQCGVAPPESVMHWLFHAFAEYETGNEPMDKLLGLTSGPGRKPARAEEEWQRVIKDLMDEIVEIKSVLGISAEYSAYMISERLEIDPMTYLLGRPHKRCQKYTEGVLRQYWHGRANKKGTPIQSRLKSIDGGDPQQLLDRYPAHCWPVST